MYDAGFLIVEGAWGGHPLRHPTIFFVTPLSKPMPHMGCPPFKLKPPPHLKNNPFPPLKHEALFHEMIPRKDTINNNLKSS